LTVKLFLQDSAKNYRSAAIFVILQNIMADISTVLPPDYSVTSFSPDGLDGMLSASLMTKRYS
jgi:hypothetical protein